MWHFGRSYGAHDDVREIFLGIFLLNKKEVVREIFSGGKLGNELFKSHFLKNFPGNFLVGFLTLLFYDIFICKLVL